MNGPLRSSVDFNHRMGLPCQMIIVCTITKTLEESMFRNKFHNRFQLLPLNQTEHHPQCWLPLIGWRWPMRSRSPVSIKRLILGTTWLDKIVVLQPSTNLVTGHPNQFWMLTGMRKILKIRVNRTLLWCDSSQQLFKACLAFLLWWPVSFESASSADH